MRHAGGFDSNEVPPMRREYELLLRRRQQITGTMVEELYGSARYLFLFVACGAAGYVLSSFVGNLSVGASGSLLGLIGALLAATTGRKSIAAQSLRSSLIRWLVYIGVLGLIMRGTDNFAHLC